MKENHIDLEALKQIKDIIDTAKYFLSNIITNTYCREIWWISEDKWEEYVKQYTKPTVTWTENGDTYSASHQVRITAKGRVIPSGIYTRNGVWCSLGPIVHSYERLLESFPELAARIDDGIFL